uniref:Uncharacterized protein n=1 Tax=Oryctolagus cuniculus TaxID=9986 RepID=A0A5F9D666_RABIT
VEGQHNHQPITNTEVLRIHMELVTVQLTQLDKIFPEVVQVIQTLTEGSQHLLAMGRHLDITHNSRFRGQVPKRYKEPLGSWVDNQHWGIQSQLPSASIDWPHHQLLHINLAPQGSECILLFTREMHHSIWNIASKHSCVKYKHKQNSIICAITSILPGHTLAVCGGWNHDQSQDSKASSVMWSLGLPTSILTTTF